MATRHKLELNNMRLAEMRHISLRDDNYDKNDAFWVTVHLYFRYSLVTVLLIFSV